MRIQLVNHQHRDSVPLAWLRRVVGCAVRQLQVNEAGWMSISFLDRQTMRNAHRRFLSHDGLTDVLSFRYSREPIVGEILVAPAFARVYAKRHQVSYRHELARYVIHGLLHWMGHDDHTPQQQRRMRQMEDNLLARCAAAK